MKKLPLKIKTNITIREQANGFLVEVYVYDARPVEGNVNCCKPQPSLGYSDETFVAKSFAEAMALAEAVRAAKVKAIEDACK